MGKSKLKSNLSKIAAAAPEYARKALKRTGDDIANLASQLAPVDTGRLRDSYTAEFTAPMIVTVGSDVEYAPHVEYGTIYMDAQEHFEPAFDEAEDTFKENLRQELQDGIDANRI